LPPGPVVDDLGSRDGQCIVGVHVVKVAETEQDVIDRLLGVLGLETGHEQRQALIGRPPGPLLDRHQIEVVAEFAVPPPRYACCGTIGAMASQVVAVSPGRIARTRSEGM
jgi:hypothetical protein